MPSLNIAVLGEDALQRANAAQAFGKKSSPEDITFFHSVFAGKIINAVEATAYPSKLSSLTQSAALCDYALVLADKPSASLGETIVALDFLRVPAVFVSLLDLAPLLNGTSLQNSKIFPEFNQAREYLLSLQSVSAPGPTTIILDHCFEVKGVGTVALGVVKRGELNVHDKLNALPLGKPVEIKSIQKNDDDVHQAEPTDRVGLALKGTKAEEMPRGTLLYAGMATPTTQVDCELSVSKFSKTPVKDGNALHFSCGLQFEPCKIKCAGEIKPGQKAAATIILEKPAAVLSGEPLLLCDLNAKGLRIIGGATTR